MISLTQPNKPFEIELPYGIRVMVRPLTTAGMAAAQAAARRQVDALSEEVRGRTESGLPLGDLPDLTDEAERDGLYQALLITALARRHIVSWEGVGDENGPAPPSPENIAGVMELFPVGERFWQELTLRQMLLTAAKNASGPSAAGSSAEGPATAATATMRTSPAPGEGAG